MSNKLPAFQFYPGDWRKDPGIQACSFAARGLWLEMMCLMHESERRGYLTLAGKPITAEQLARQTGGAAVEVVALLAELETAGVFSRDEQGVIFSRRMDRDEHIRRVRSEAGKLGSVHGYKGGRPRIDGGGKRQKGQTKGQKNRGGVLEGVSVSYRTDSAGGQKSLFGDEEGVSKRQKGQTERQTEGQSERQTERQNNPPSSSSSSSEVIPAVAGGVGTERVSKKPKVDPTADPLFAQFWAAYPRRVQKADALKAFTRARTSGAITNETFASILAAIGRQSQSRDWLKDEGQYIPYPASWINGRRWEDEIGITPPVPATESERVSPTKLAMHHTLAPTEAELYERDR